MKNSVYIQVPKKMMRFCMFIILLMTFSAYSQTTLTLRQNANIESVTSLISYSKDARGFWVKRPPQKIENFSDLYSASLLGKNNKDRTIYALTETSIIEMTLDKKTYSGYKGEKGLINLKVNEWNNLFDIEADKLANKFQKLNELRDREIEDSVAEVRRIEKLKAEEAARREARRRDSIQSAEQDKKYRETHNFNELNLSSLKQNLNYSDERSLLKCVVGGCDHRITGSDIILVGLTKDTLVYADYTTLTFDIMFTKFHALVLNDKLTQDPDISRHLRVWGDSLKLETKSAINFINMANYLSAEKYIAELVKRAPNGYVESWEWDNEYGPVSFKVSYCNTNKKTIKYIKFFFSVYNDVGDVRGSGSVQGTGPVEELESASWNFDRTGCWPSGDASKMRITKIFITYMNGSTITLTGDKIKYN